MKVSLYFAGILAALIATEATAQPINLTGRYRCVVNCRDGLVGSRTYVTQNRWDFNLLNETGETSRAWLDWFTPNRIWVQNWNQGAVYAPDGMTIQFDRGSIWRRDLGLPPPRLRER